MKPNPMFKYIAPDTVAECWDGVYSFGNLYEQLWACVAKYEAIDKENCGPADVIGINCVAEYWDMFSDVNKAKLNELASEQDKWYKFLIED